MTRNLADESLAVLVVDDYPDSANGLAELVRIWGWSAESTRTGEEALRIAERTPPRVVILDIGMQPMSGIEVAKRLRQSPATARSAILALTGSVPPRQSSSLLAEGFDAYLHKPGDPETLRRVLTDFLGPGVSSV